MHFEGWWDSPKEQNISNNVNYMISQDQSAQAEESIWELLLLQTTLQASSSFLSTIIISFWVNVEEKKSRKKYEAGLWGLGGRQQSGPPGRSLLLSHETLLVFPFLDLLDTVFLFGAWQKQNKTKQNQPNTMTTLEWFQCKKERVFLWGKLSYQENRQLFRDRARDDNCIPTMFSLGHQDTSFSLPREEQRICLC